MEKLEKRRDPYFGGHVRVTPAWGLLLDWAAQQADFWTRIPPLPTNSPTTPSSPPQPCPPLEQCQVSKFGVTSKWSDIEALTWPLVPVLGTLKTKHVSEYIWAAT
jgi:hypothetical protein